MIVSPLVLKVTLAPALIASVSVLQRRLGPAIGGLLTGMPVAAGPVLLALAIDFGPKFAADASIAALQALVAVAVFSCAYANTALRWKQRWPASIAIAFIAYSIAVSLISIAPLPWPVAFPLTAAAAWAAVRLMPGYSIDLAVKRSGPPWWDIPLRMALAAFLVWAVAAIGPRVGPRWSGLLTPFPVATTILAVFTHSHDGAASAVGFLKGLVTGMLSLAVFFCAAAALLPELGTTAAFLWATAASLAVSVILWLATSERYCMKPHDSLQI